MANMKSEEELAELEKLSANYVPEQKGDLVGRKVSSNLLTEEYAKADPAYASKTKNLPATYPEYRTIKGDGNCGFRAIAYGYFEALVRLGDPSRIKAEAARLSSLNNLLDATGQEKYMYEDWVEETIHLLEKVASTPAGDIETVLLQAFNDLEKANSITQHFRMITSAQLKLNPDDYAPFVPDLDVENYCKNHVDPFYEEIEHIGVKALVDSIINPAGVAVGYLYLDRSSGEEATPYSFPVYANDGSEVTGAPTIRLLYRPGHYDLLYKQEDIALSSSLPTSVGQQQASGSNQSVQINVVLDTNDTYFPSDVECDGLPGLDPQAMFYHDEPEAYRFNADISSEYVERSELPPMLVKEATGDSNEVCHINPVHLNLNHAQDSKPTVSQEPTEEPSSSTSLQSSQQSTVTQSSVDTDNVKDDKEVESSAPSESTLKGKPRQELLNWNPKTSRQEDYDRSAASDRYSSPMN